uniref:HECT domain-containing protein n=1 Tax=Amphiprion percula TaxID=161767 RepID=A0A3P8U8X8_AMPPE
MSEWVLKFLSKVKNLCKDMKKQIVGLASDINLKLQEMTRDTLYCQKYSLTCLDSHMSISDIPFLIHRVQYDVSPPFAAITALTLLFTRFRSVFMGIFDHSSRSTFVRSHTDFQLKIHLTGFFPTEKQTGLSLNDILMFATGLNTLPPTGIHPRPRLVFQETSRFPVSSTCANTIQIPMSPDYKQFWNSKLAWIWNTKRKSRTRKQKISHHRSLKKK